MRRWHRRALRAPLRLKETSLAALLATDIGHEIEALVGRQAVDELDLEALEMAVRQPALPLADTRRRAATQGRLRR